MLLAESDRFFVAGWDGSYREVTCISQGTAMAVTADLRFAVFGQSGLVLVDLRKDSTIGSPLVQYELRQARITASASFAVVLAYRTLYFWTPREEQSWRGLTNLLAIHSYPERDEKPTEYVISSNGRLLHLRGNVYDLVTGKLIRRFKEAAEECVSAFSGDGRMLAISKPDGVLLVFDVQEGRQIAEIRCRGEAIRNWTCAPSLTFSPDGTFVLMRTDEGFFSVVDLRASAARKLASSPPPLQGAEVRSCVTRSQCGEVILEAVESHKSDGRSWEQLEWYRLGRATHNWTSVALRDEYAAPERAAGRSFADIEDLWVPRAGFTLDKLRSSDGHLKLRIDLISQHYEIDWTLQTKMLEWQDQKAPKEIAWELVDVIGDLVIGAAYPNILLTIDLESARLRSITNVGDFEINIPRLSISGAWVGATSHTENAAGLWDVSKNTWRTYQRSMQAELAERVSIGRVVPFPWLDRLVILDQELRVIGWISVATDQVVLSDGREIRVGAHVYAIPNSNVMIASTGHDHDGLGGETGLLLVDAFDRSESGHIHFESAIRHLVRLTPTRFCAVFTDYSAQEVEVVGNDPSSS